jgi:DNA polymerase-1
LNINAQLIQNNLKSRALLQVHDELIFEVMPDETKILEGIVRAQMAAAFKLRVKLDVNIGFGESWDLAAH